MTSPTFGDGLLTVLASARSACCGVTLALPPLLVVTGSNWSLWLIDAAFVRASGLDTTAWISRVRGLAVVTVPTVQTPVLLLYVPWLGAADTNVSPIGSRS